MLWSDSSTLWLPVTSKLKYMPSYMSEGSNLGILVSFSHAGRNGHKLCQYHGTNRFREELHTRERPVSSRLIGCPTTYITDIWIVCLNKPQAIKILLRQSNHSSVLQHSFRAFQSTPHHAKQGEQCPYYYTEPSHVFSPSNICPVARRVCRDG